MRSLIIMAAVLAACLCAPASGADRLRALAAPGKTYAATVVSITDGDTIRVDVPAWADTPFTPIGVRVSGIDTPESRKPPAKCKAEVAKGKAASAYAKTIVHPGDVVTIRVNGLDKYARLDADIIMPDGRDFGTVMLASGGAFPYAGGTKRRYCP